MAKIISLRLLVEDDFEMDLNEILSNILVLDAVVDDESPVNNELEDSVVNETYSLGDAFIDWLIYAKSERDDDDPQSGYWSNSYGWGSRDLATRFESSSPCSLPLSKGGDAMWVLAPKLN